MKYNIGYTTGTYDLIHKGHYEILRKCKLYCDYLIVGLVTDDLAERQKRKAILKFDHRKDQLENSKYVDAVVEFNGNSKQTDWDKLNFDVLFIADEYYGVEEYSSFKETPIIYIPRTSNISTSNTYKQIIYDVLSNVKVRASGISGDVLSLAYKKDKNIIIKPVKVSYKDSLNTDNNYNLPMPPPRNWKMISVPNENHPMITGVNPMREIKIFNLLKDKPWYPVIKIEEKDTFYVKYVNECNDISRMLKERELGKLFWLIQKDGGKTLTDYVKDLDEGRRSDIYIKVLDIIDELRELDILNMDIHPNNILVNEEGEVSLIDFGWCLHKSFDLNQEEMNYYNDSLTENFDYKHFIESLIYCGIEKKGFIESVF